MDLRGSSAVITSSTGRKCSVKAILLRSKSQNCCWRISACFSEHPDDADYIFLQAALNGDRIHPAPPRTATAIAEATRAAAAARALSVYVHAFDDAGQATLDGAACTKVLRANRARCPDTPISLTTSAAIFRCRSLPHRIPPKTWESL
jgi:hypothetical protein